MNSKPLRFLLLFCVIALCLTTGASAADAYHDTLRNGDTTVLDTNSDTGYTVRIVDEEKLLSARELGLLSMTMRPLTDYGDAVFWSCSVSSDEQEKQLDRWQDEADGSTRSTCVIVINLQTWNVNMYTGGAIWRTVGDDKLQEISDSVIDYASAGEYYTCANEGFRRVYKMLSGGSETQPATEAAEKDPTPAAQAVRYTNPDTGCEVRIIDDSDLLTDEEEARLVTDMIPITDYGHIMFWSTDERSADAEIQAREKRASFYGRDSAGILSVNMADRKVVFHSDGAIYDAVSSSYARSITDNASGYASAGDYYGCAREVFEEVNRVLHGQAIAEPMKYISYVIIALMLAFVIVVGLAFGKRFNPLLRQNRHQAKVVGTGALLATQPIVAKKNTSARTWVKVVGIILMSLFSGDGSGSSGGSSGGGGGGGGSSGGGGGGSSSF